VDGVGPVIYFFCQFFECKMPFLFENTLHFSKNLFNKLILEYKYISEN
jgi:hypothetical protein